MQLSYATWTHSALHYPNYRDPTNYLKILYDTHAINAYDNLHQGSNESTSVYLHRAQDILECIHHTSDMTSISAISTNHVKILTGLKDSKV